jgi:TolB protein
MTIKQSTAIILLLLLPLTACATSNKSPTPTIVLLDRSATVQNQAQFDDAPPTATRIPAPQPTPTLTALPTPPPDLPVVKTPTPVSVPQAEVIVAWLNVRQGPGVDYPVIDLARAGDVDREWLQVETEAGGPGWISGQLPYSRLLTAGLDIVPVVQPSPAISSSATISEPSRIASSNSELSGRLVFMTGSGGELNLIHVDGSGLRRLTGGVIDPVVSPDGQQVAFTRWDGAEFGVLYTINLDGTGERAILGDIRQPKSPTWSPDGQQIAISFQAGGLRDPSEECKRFGPGQDISIPGEHVTITSVRVSGDGSVKICFIRHRDLKWRLRQIDVTTGKFEDLPSDEYSYNPAWDPKNPWRVIYDGNQGLVQVDVTNGHRWPVTEDLRDSGPVFSPDGQTLALTYKQHDHWEVYTYHWEVYTYHLDSGARRRLTKPPILAEPQYNSASPAWSPDGSHLAFVTDRTGRWEIWVMNADGSNQQPLFPASSQAQLGLTYHGMNERMLNWIE